MTASAYSAPGWEVGPRARNISEQPDKVRRKAGWAKSHLSWAYPVFLLWDGCRFWFCGISGRSCESDPDIRQGWLDFPLVFLVFLLPTLLRSRSPRRLMATFSYC